MAKLVFAILMLGVSLNQFTTSAYASQDCPNTVEEAVFQIGGLSTGWIVEDEFHMSYEGFPLRERMVPPNGIVHFTRGGMQTALLSFDSSSFQVECLQVPSKGLRTYNPPLYCPPSAIDASLRIGGLHWSESNTTGQPFFELTFAASPTDGISFTIPLGGVGKKSDEEIYYPAGWSFTISPGQIGTLQCYKP